MKKEFLFMLLSLLLVGCVQQEKEPTNSNQIDNLTLYKTMPADWILDQGWSIVNNNPLAFKGTGHTWNTLNQNLNGNSLMRFTPTKTNMHNLATLLKPEN